MNKYIREVRQGERFEFGINWDQFIKVLDEDRILEAEKSLKIMLAVDNLYSKSFLDIGSGSGIFSLAARRLGARVHSFDYDPYSVACTNKVKQRFFPNDALWTIEQGNVLDIDYLKSLGKFDVVYAWGVLHHTGAMWQALENVQHLVSLHKRLFISIYNDQGGASRRWLIIKRFYNRSPRFLRIILVAAIGCYFEVCKAFIKLVRLQNPLPFKDWAAYKKNRGMSCWTGLIDWVGGYPFEVAKPEEIFNFFHARGFELTNLKTCGGGYGCNEFVFMRTEGRNK